MASGLLDLLDCAASPATDADIIELVVSPYGIARSSAEWRHVQVRRQGHGASQSTTLVLTTAVDDLTPDRAHEMLGRVAMAAYYAGHDGSYFRIRFAGNGRAVAYWDNESESGAVMVDDEVNDLPSLEPPWPDWSLRLDELAEELEHLMPYQATSG